MICNLCPRRCGVDRARGSGFCGVGEDIVVSRAAPHFWEEPCISGTSGSGAVFFSGCSLQCVFCQNHEISRAPHGSTVTPYGLYDIFCQLKAAGVHNINLVTADHYISQILPALRRARELSLPLVLNTSSYLDERTVRALDGVIDVYLADFKFFDPRVAKKYADADDYPEVAKKAIAEMVRQTGAPRFENGIMTRGVIVRVLVLPENIIDAKRTVKYLHDSYGDSISISIMSQYTPVCDTPFAELSRRLTDREYKSVVDYAVSHGVTRAFVQQKSSAQQAYIPDFK